MGRRVILMLGAISLCLATALGCTSTTPPATSSPGPWVTYRAGDNNAASNPGETRLGPTNVARLHQAWALPVASPQQSAAPPLVSGSTVVETTYLSAANSRSSPVGRVVALQMTTGKVLWSRSFPRGVSVAAIFQGVVVTTLTQTSYDPTGQWPYPELAGISLTTGATLWTRQATDDAASWGAALTGDGKLFLSGPNGTGAFNAVTGGYTTLFPWVPQRGAAYADGRIFTVDGTSLPLISYDAKTGVPLNQYNVPVGGDEWNEPIAYGNRIYIASALTSQPGGDAAVVAAFDQQGCAGTVCGAAWKTFLPDPIRSAMTVDNGRIFAVGVYGDVYALDANTGKLLWKGHAPTSTADLSSANGVLYVLNTGDQLQTYAESGCGAAVCKPLAVINDPVPAHGVAIFPPVIANGYVLYANSNGLRALTAP